MRTNWQSVLNAAVALWKRFLSGKTVHIGGQDVILPNETQTPPLRGSKFDSVPHKMEPPPLRGGRP